MVEEEENQMNFEASQTDVQQQAEDRKGKGKI